MPASIKDIQVSYDRLAAEYASRFQTEMERKPFDRKMLDWLAEKVGGLGPICDMGCGPGQIARYLHSRGVAACGIDLSAEMVAHAQRFNPDIAFQQGDMLALTNIEEGAFGGIAAFYSIIHIAHGQVVAALEELRRVLRPGGVLLMTFHVGDEIRHVGELWGQQVSLDFIFFEREEMKEFLATAGFVMDEVIERDPYPPEIEVQTRRAYIFAHK
jgi:SAM-dependent methyltransferase